MRRGCFTEPVPKSPGNGQRGLLFTAFEPSGDEHAAWVIAELKRRYPALPIYAWGGPRMEQAGATIVERTGDDAVMGMPGLKKILEHQRINQRVETWLAKHPVRALIPVDSPAANGPLCEIAKERGLKVIHLIAPQIWAWGRWRIHKLRRLTDLVLCVLPFEASFFERRRVPARFIGHFLFDQTRDAAELDRRCATFGDGRPKIAMMPGSRPDELERHFPVLLSAYATLAKMYPGASGVVAATSDSVAAGLRRMAEARGGWPEGLKIVVRDTDAVIHWCDLALVKSGTVTLQVAKGRKPMVVFYKKANPVLFLMARAVLSTRVFSLPNVLARARIVPELIPHYGGAGPIVQAANKLLADPVAVQHQLHEIDRILEPFRGRNAASQAADAIEEVLGLRGAAAHAA
ncbi:MAG: lipid-A-disaccharide synthase [Phycisphaerae bacterium]|nr:MAG: lipid-A-disaccharide synthase [Phycisphaerae bacterium]